MNRWVGLLVVACWGLVVFWSWQAWGERRYLTEERHLLQRAVAQLRTDKDRLTAELAAAQAALAQVQTTHAELIDTLQSLEASLKQAEVSRTQIAAHLDALLAQEALWSLEKEALNERMARLEQEKRQLERQLSALEEAPTAPATETKRARSLPATAGAPPDLGNRGFLLRGGRAVRPTPPVRVEVRPTVPLPAPRDDNE